MPVQFSPHCTVPLFISKWNAGILCIPPRFVPVGQQSTIFNLQSTIYNLQFAIALACFPCFVFARQQLTIYNLLVFLTILTIYNCPCLFSLFYLCQATIYHHFNCTASSAKGSEKRTFSTELF